MNKYPYLSDESKARNLSLLLIGASAILGLLNLFMKNNIVNGISTVLATILFGFAMHYLDYHNVQGQSIKKYILCFHCFAIHALVHFFLGFAGEPGTLSFQVLSGLGDAMLVAALLTLGKIFKPLVNNTIVIVLSLLAFVLSMFGIELPLDLIIICAAALLVYLSYQESLISAGLGVLAILLCFVCLFSKDLNNMHFYLHALSIILMMLVTYMFYDKVSPKDSLDTIDISRSTPAAGDRNVTKSTSRSYLPYTDYEVDESWFKKNYQNKSYEDLLDAPLTAFKGVSDAMAKDMKAAFGIDTIRELAESKYFQWAKEIVEEANK